MIQRRREHELKKYNSKARALFHVPPFPVKNHQTSPASPSLRVSLRITEEIIKSKEELQKMVIIKVKLGNDCAHFLSLTQSEILNIDLYGTVTPLMIILFSPCSQT